MFNIYIFCIILMLDEYGVSNVVGFIFVIVIVMSLLIPISSNIIDSKGKQVEEDLYNSHKDFLLFLGEELYDIQENSQLDYFLELNTDYYSVFDFKNDTSFYVRDNILVIDYYDFNHYNGVDYMFINELGSIISVMDNSHYSIVDYDFIKVYDNKIITNYYNFDGNDDYFGGEKDFDFDVNISENNSIVENELEISIDSGYKYDNYTDFNELVDYIDNFNNYSAVLDSENNNIDISIENNITYTEYNKEIIIL